MDFLSQAFAQIGDLFRSMSAGARLMTGLLLVVVVVSLGWLFQQNVSGGDSWLLAGEHFSADQINRMEGAFGKANLSGWSVEGQRIRIPNGQQAKFLAALVDGGAMPASFGTYLSEAVSGANPFLSRQQEEEKRKVAMQKELALVLGKLDGVQSASVFYESKQRQGFAARGAREGSASVFLTLDGTKAFEEHRVLQIRQLVASSFGDLSPKNVTVTDTEGFVFSGGNESDPAGGENSYLSVMRKYQHEYEQTVRSALSHIAGVTVSASVVLSTDQSHLIEKVSVDSKGAVAIRSVDNTTSETSESPVTGGRPGLESQSANTGARVASASGGPRRNSEATTSEVQNVVPHDKTVIVKAPLVPEKVTMAIGVPDTYFVKLWQLANPPKEGEKPGTPDAAGLNAIREKSTNDIRTHVANLLPNEETAGDPAANVIVTTFSHVPTPEIAAPSTAEVALGFLGGNWNTIALAGLVGVSLLMLRSMVSGGAGATAAAEPSPKFPPLVVSPALIQAAAERAVPAAPVATVAATAAEAAAEAEAERIRPKFKRDGAGELREDLADLVREDPDTAANILRGWIGSTN